MVGMLVLAACPAETVVASTEEEVGKESEGKLGVAYMIYKEDNLLMSSRQPH